MAPETSFVLKRGEGLHNPNMIKHKVLLDVETPRGSNVDSATPKMVPVAGPNGTKPVKTSYVSPMQRARQEKKRREAAHSKDWDEASNSPSASSEVSSLSNGGTPPPKPTRVISFSGGLIPASGNLIPPSGNLIPPSGKLIPPSGKLIPSSGNLIPSSGYVAKPRDSTATDGLNGSGRLPKFGVWENQNDTSEPCYTLLFENVAQEKRVGGPIRIHANRPASPARCEDLYDYNPIKSRKYKHLHLSLLCCFVGS